MTETEVIITKLSKDFHVLKKSVEGNGSQKGSIIGRLAELEDNYKLIIKKLNILELKPCREPCIFETWKKKDEKMKEKRRNFRSGDVAD